QATAALISGSKQPPTYLPSSRLRDSMRPMADGFTIRIYVPDGDPDGVRIIDRLTSTGVAIVFPREVWSRVRNRSEFGKAGVYILTGYADADDLPTLYIGQSDDMRTRTDSHAEKKDFWDWGLIF